MPNFGVFGELGREWNDGALCGFNYLAVGDLYGGTGGCVKDAGAMRRGGWIKVMTGGAGVYNSSVVCLVG